MSELSKAVREIGKQAAEEGIGAVSDREAARINAEKISLAMNNFKEIQDYLGAITATIVETANILREATEKGTDNTSKVSYRAERMSEVLAAALRVTEETENHDAIDARGTAGLADLKAKESKSQHTQAQDLLERVSAWPAQLMKVIGDASVKHAVIGVQLKEARERTFTSAEMSEEAAAASHGTAEFLENYGEAIA